MSLRKPIILPILLTLLPTLAWAGNAGDNISVQSIYALAVPPGADNTVAFMVLKNTDTMPHALTKATSPAARDCIALAGRFRSEKSELWLEDWGGGSNPRLTNAD